MGREAPMEKERYHPFFVSPETRPTNSSPGSSFHPSYARGGRTLPFHFQKNGHTFTIPKLYFEFVKNDTKSNNTTATAEGFVASGI
jgi:hypothetical protein